MSLFLANKKVMKVICKQQSFCLFFFFFFAKTAFCMYKLNKLSAEKNICLHSTGDSFTVSYVLYSIVLYEIDTLYLLFSVIIKSICQDLYLWYTLWYDIFWVKSALYAIITLILKHEPVKEYCIPYQSFNKCAQTYMQLFM